MLGYSKTPHTFRCEGMPPTTLLEPPPFGWEDDYWDFKSFKLHAMPTADPT